MDLTGLLSAAREIAVSLPFPITVQLAQAFEAFEQCPAQESLLGLGSTGRSRDLLSKLGAEWAALGPGVEGRTVAVALLAAGQTAAALQRERSIEIAWTGPSTSAVPTRRVDQVLYELIDQARAEVWLISYVAYRAERAIEALATASQRGVEIRLILELASESGGRLAFDTARELKARIPSARIFFWPLERRRRDEFGRYGILHAKCIVADRAVALVSSANLTDYALEMNMELGLVVRGGEIPRYLGDHFAQLIVRGELEELS